MNWIEITDVWFQLSTNPHNWLSIPQRWLCRAVSLCLPAAVPGCSHRSLHITPRTLGLSKRKADAFSNVIIKVDGSMDSSMHVSFPQLQSGWAGLSLSNKTEGSNDPTIRELIDLNLSPCWQSHAVTCVRRSFPLPLPGPAPQDRGPVLFRLLLVDVGDLCLCPVQEQVVVPSVYINICV